MEEHFCEENSEDLSYSDLDSFPSFLLDKAQSFTSLQLDHNEITILPRAVGLFTNLICLDISNNNMTYMSPEIVHLQKLKTLTARNNRFDCDSFPKEVAALTSLQVINLSGNNFTEFPEQLISLVSLRCLYFGGNRIASLPREIVKLKRLEILYLGGNNLTSIPDEVGYLSQLTSLVLCDNKLQSLPRSFLHLRKLQSLSLHNNQLSTLPPEIVGLDLVELSLRNNPLVVRFVQDIVYEPPSLLEMAGRCVKTHHIKYSTDDLPRNLHEYLDSAQRCVNPKCKGVYFTSRVEHVKFVDFCGKYRLPLLQYLCSPNCTSTCPIVCAGSDSESDEDSPVSKMKRVLLG